jgi:hypothetical protein
VTSGAWSTAVLSKSRGGLAATSLPNLGVAIFAGGEITGSHADSLFFEGCVFCAVGNLIAQAGEKVVSQIACANLIHSFCRKRAI